MSCLSVRTGAPAACVLRWKKWEKKGTVSLLGEAAVVAQTGNKEMWDPQKTGWELLKLPSPVPLRPSLATALCLLFSEATCPNHQAIGLYLPFFFSAACVDCISVSLTSHLVPPTRFWNEGKEVTQPCPHLSTALLGARCCAARVVSDATQGGMARQLLVTACWAAEGRLLHAWFRCCYLWVQLAPGPSSSQLSVRSGAACCPDMSAREALAPNGVPCSVAQRVRATHAAQAWAQVSTLRQREESPALLAPAWLWRAVTGWYGGAVCARAKAPCIGTCTRVSGSGQC